MSKHFFYVRSRFILRGKSPLNSLLEHICTHRNVETLQSVTD